LLETGTSNAAAVDSVTFFRGPFRVTDNFNFSGDHLTRIIIFTLPLANPDQTLSVKASGIDLPIESVGNVTGVERPQRFVHHREVAAGTPGQSTDHLRLDRDLAKCDEQHSGLDNHPLTSAKMA
jgi:hypothetical protein